MDEQGIYIKKLPVLRKPLLIAGFDGWGNALDVSMGTAEYLIRKLNAEYFARINADTFYRYDETRPMVTVEEGVLKNILHPGGGFYAAKTPWNQDIVILKANEPVLRWFRFTEELFSLCKKLDVETIITLGSMYDNVLHTDRIISGIASDHNLFLRMKAEGVIPVSYQGPGAIHAAIHSAGQKRGVQCLGLWAHCPYYVEGVTHFGLLAGVSDLLADLWNFDLDTEDLEESWEELNKKIETMIEENPDVRDAVKEIRKEKMRDVRATMKASLQKGEKIINLQDFLEPK